MDENSIIEKFIGDQLSVWPEVAARYRSLKNASVKKMNVNGLEILVQHNPDRIISSAAEPGPEDAAEDKCFLCAANRPDKQMSLRFEGRKGRLYDVVVNPYPIFQQHLVIARYGHVPQSIWNNYVDMADLAHHYTGYTFFYNGPMSGASAPYHLHFQACRRGVLPLEAEADRLLDMTVCREAGVPDADERPTVPEAISSDIEYVASVQEAQLYHYKHLCRGIFFLRARTSKSMAKLFYRLLDCADIPDGGEEPLFNLFTWYKGEGERPAGNTHGLADFEYRAIVVLRSKHRPSNYESAGPDHLTMSPGCADMAGYVVAPVGEEYVKLTPGLLASVFDEVAPDAETEQRVLWRLTRTQPVIQVGIMSGHEIEFEIISDGAGPQKVSYQEGKIAYNGALYDELTFDARTMSTLFAEPTFILYGVTIGIDFHWERKLTQRFAGSLKFIIENGKVYAVNVIGVEDYLLSVISSEMKSSATLEYLKAHSVISRSWVMSQIRGRQDRKGPDEAELKAMNNVPSLVTALESARNEDVDTDVYIKWFDHDDHINFDVCADDHCQRYQGLSMAVGDNVRKAIDQTWGQVLMWNGEICDCRFYKSCGGKTELFSTCWGDKDYPYLPSLPDTPGHDPHAHCYCDTDDVHVLSQVLNDYDLETKDFFHWTVRYTREGISRLVAERSGIDFGTIMDLIPLETGPSGRIWKMKIVGTKRSMVIGKELIIRRWLSTSHLKSSAFTVKWEGDDLTLDGYGWGHGVGLCQIGAAVMAYDGCGYREILEHYYPNSELKRI